MVADPSPLFYIYAHAVVVRTGDRTLIGQIAALTGGESGNKSPLAVEMYVVLLSFMPLFERAHNLLC